MPIAWTYVGPEMSAVTYAATVTVDTSIADKFTTDLAGNIIVAAPANPTDGASFLYRFRAGAAARTVTLTTTAGGFRGTTSNTTAAKALAANKVGYLMAMYDATSGFWDLLSWDVAG